MSILPTYIVIKVSARSGGTSPSSTETVDFVSGDFNPISDARSRIAITGGADEPSCSVAAFTALRSGLSVNILPLAAFWTVDPAVMMLLESSPSLSSNAPTVLSS